MNFFLGGGNQTFQRLPDSLERTSVNGDVNKVDEGADDKMKDVQMAVRAPV